MNNTKSHVASSPVASSIVIRCVLGVAVAAGGGCDRGRDPLVPRPGASPAEAPGLVEERRKMVEILGETIGVDTDGNRRLLEVLERLPRHEFVPPSLHAHAYDVRTPLPIGENQTISSPEMVAIMTAALKLRGDEKVLEIGTGSGYQAAVLGELVKEVYTIEIRPQLAREASKKLRTLRDQGFLRHDRVTVIEGNGYKGYAAAAPYDAIMVTAAPPEIPVELINQLGEGGRMVIPVGDFYQKLQVISRRPDGMLDQEIIQTVRFVRMVDE